MHALNNNVTYFDNFGVEHIPKEIKIFVDKFIVVANIFRIRAYDSLMCGFYACRQDLTDFTELFSPNNYKKNDDIVLKYFMTNF